MDTYEHILTIIEETQTRVGNAACIEDIDTLLDKHLVTEYSESQYPLNDSEIHLFMPM
jgi:hypothetical protein